ncbi:MAG: CSLREA domain-containing protein, partial [Chloroflexi bacterium]|nr:CSLREA domain-containing protein [Chloroflexota bacterium]
MRSSQFTQLFKVLLAFILTIGVVSVSWAAVATTSQNSSELIVNTTSDEHDVLPGDGLCQTAANDCSLRAALEEANVLSGIDHISFNIPGTASHTILPHSPLPPIIEAVIIDGHTEPDYVHAPVIILDGSQAGEQATGLMIVAGNSIVRGLAIHSFEYSGLTLLGGGNSRIESNYLGTTGTLAQGNQIGILVEGSTQNSIGGNAAGNLISGNEIGIYLYGLGSSENRVAANFIGTDADGTTVIGNEYGIRITAADGNLIGGNTAAARNVITGNETGIYIQGKGSSGNRIWGNYIGLDITGETILGNEALGIYILDAPGNQVGGPTTRGNVIAGGELGVYVRGQGSKGNLVRNNLIGTNADQEQPAERISGGVLIIDAENTNVGGSQSKQGNHIVTEQYGVRLRGTAVGKTSIENNSLDVFDDQKEEEENRSEEGAAIDSTSTTAYSSPAPTDPAALVWNFKGREIRAGRLFAKLSQRPFRQSGSTFTVNSTGDAGDANIGDGICADSGGNCTLRAAIEEANDTVATDTIAFNIPGTGPHTIQPNSQLPTLAETTILDGSTEPDFAGTPIIELDGSNAGAGASGLKVAGTDCIIRGLVINRFDNDGIFLDTEAVNATIEGNYIGTNISGTVALGNLDDGITLWETANATIGGVTTATRNLISGNADDGILLYNEGADGNLIQGNVIGLDINGAVDLGNGGNGIQILTGDANTIGGTTAGAGNLISGNDWNGIRLAWGSNNNTIQGNIIGLDVSGMIDLGNGNHGIDFNNATDNTIGGTTTTARNIIAGNDQDGIHLTSPATIGSLIQGNYIGTNISGAAALGNGDDGIDVSNGANNTTIGGATAGEGNLISGNGDEGIHLTSNTNSTAEILVQGNYIGTNAAGTAVIGNGDMGI